MTKEELIKDLETQIESVDAEIRASMHCPKCLLNLRIQRFELIKEFEDAIRDTGSIDTK